MRHQIWCVNVELTNILEPEFIPLQSVSIDASWVDIVNARRHQQETYTTILRRTRGPRTTRLPK
jgi:hypothetical protein